LIFEDGYFSAGKDATRALAYIEVLVDYSLEGFSIQLSDFATGLAVVLLQIHRHLAALISKLNGIA